MSGETEKEISGWTTDTLHSHLIRMMDERDRRYEQRFQSQETARINLEKSTTDKFASVNEFRQQQSDIVANYMPRAETEQRIKQVDDKIDASIRTRAEAVSVINSRLDILTGKSAGSNAFVGYIVAAASAGAAIAVILNAVLK